MSEAEKYYRKVKGLSVEKYPILGYENHGVIQWMEDFHNHMNQVKNNDLLHSVSKCYTEQDMDNAYDKGFKDGNQRDFTI